MSKLNYTELDFNKIKENFKEFLRSKTEYSDFDFDGSGWSILLDILAYNTSANAFYLNMVGNEMFLDSAVLRESIVSRAKHLGYTPRSRRSAAATVDVEIFPAFGPGNPNPGSIFLSTDEQFFTLIDSVKYYFYPKVAQTIIPQAGKYIARGVELIEGLKLTHRWNVDLSLSVKQRYIIPNANVDTTTITVKVQESNTNPSQKVYRLHEDLTKITKDSLVYFLQEVDGGKFELRFGDGVVGKALETGNILIVEYQVSSADVVNGAKVFTPSFKLAGYDKSKVTLVTPAQFGTERESDESIKLLAPLNYDSQNRAVTRTDYETLIKKDVPQAKYVRVWGGEDNDPPEYGKVFVAIQPMSGFAFSADQKQNIINSLIRPRNVVSVQTVIVEPDYLSIVPSIKVMFTSRTTALTANDIKNLVLQTIRNFREKELNGFDSDFRYSKFVRAIDESDESISGNLTSITLKYKIIPPFNVPTKFDFTLNNKLSRGDAKNDISSITSSGFIYRGVLTYIGDDGGGALYLYRIVNDKRVIIQRNIGTVNYETGRILINSLSVQSIPNDIEHISIYAKPLKNDVEALRNQILLIEDDDILIGVEDLSSQII
jgi:hypothetical protein